MELRTTQTLIISSYHALNQHLNAVWGKINGVDKGKSMMYAL